jgi:hypothetical protein
LASSEVIKGVIAYLKRKRVYTLMKYDVVTSIAETSPIMTPSMPLTLDFSCREPFNYYDF